MSRGKHASVSWRNRLKARAIRDIEEQKNKSQGYWFTPAGSKEKVWVPYDKKHKEVIGRNLHQYTPNHLIR